MAMTISVTPRLHIDRQCASAFFWSAGIRRRALDVTRSLGRNTGIKQRLKRPFISIATSPFLLRWGAGRKEQPRR
jgi:hypothetical protein